MAKKAVVVMLMLTIFSALFIQGTESVDSIEAWVNVTLNGLLPSTPQNQSTVNVPLLIQTLNQLASTNREFEMLANAVVSAVEEQRLNSGVTIVECLAGSYTDPMTTLCLPCLPGKYSDVVHAVSPNTCQSCGMGKYSTAMGPNSSATCVKCPIGTYGNKSGAPTLGSCTPCQAGATTLQPGAQTVELCVCKPGFYLQSGQCMLCDVGYYCDGTVQNECPLHFQGMSTSQPGTTDSGNCFCNPGYYGTTWDSSNYCTVCNVGSFCPGVVENSMTAQYTCPDHSTSRPGSTSVDDCTCSPSYRRKLSDPAQREFTVNAAPCACTTALGSDSECANSISPCECTKDQVCAPGKTLTCRQGYVNLNIANAYPSTTVAGILQTVSWYLAPEGAKSVSVTFTKYLIPLSGSLKIYDCPSIMDCTAGNMRATSGYAVGTTVSTRDGYPVMRLDWSAGAAGTTGTVVQGWQLTYSSVMANCATTTIPLILTSITYLSTGQYIGNPEQPNADWPIIAWAGDVITFQILEPKNAYIRPDVRLAAGPGNSVLDATWLNGWTPGLGTYYIVDPAMPTRSRRLIVKSTDVQNLLVYYTAVTGTGSYTLTGSVEGTNSPEIVLVVGDTLVMSRLTDGNGLIILSSYTNASVYTVASGILGQSTSTVAYSSLTWNTVGAAPGMYYYTSAVNPGVFSKGRIMLSDRPNGIECVYCSPGEYCYNGNPQSCPANSVSPSGSDGIEDCTCVPGFARETADVSSYVNNQTVDCGGRHSCVVTEGGGLWCWGANDAYQLGLGRKSVWEPPTRVNISGVLNVSLGDNFTCVVLGADMKTRCWGDNYYGQLGLDDSMDNSGSKLPYELGNAKLGGYSSDPVPVPVDYRTLQLSCGVTSCCAIILKFFGQNTLMSLTCWGRGKEGQLGNGFNAAFRKSIGTGKGLSSSDPRASFESMGGTNSLVSVSNHIPVLVSMGGSHACAITTTTTPGLDGSVWCWGYNNYGSLGIGMTPSFQNPTIVDVGGPAKAINCYNDVCCVVMQTTYQVKCWGKGAGGRLGTGVFNVGETTGSMGVNLQPVPLGSKMYAMDVNVGATQTCALLGNNHVKCWGLIASTVVGTNPPLQMSEMLPVLDMQTSRVALQIGGKGATTCSVLSDYRVVCWGGNDWKQLGGIPGVLVSTGSRRLMSRSLLQIQGLVDGKVPANQTNMTMVTLPSGVIALRATGVPTVLVCSMCLENTFCTGDGGAAHQCPNLTVSKVQSTDSSSCLCQRGYEGNGASGCQICTGAKYCNVGVAASCPAFSTTLQDGAFNVSQCMCMPGYTGASGLACSPCRTGTYKDTYGPGACIQCPAGTVSNVVGLGNLSGCSSCQAGMFSTAGSFECKWCQTGYIAKPGSGACDMCKQGFYTSPTLDTCLACPVGTYDESALSADLSSCIPCSPGLASNVTNATSSTTCVRCKAGTISQTGAASCTPCDPGYYSLEGTASGVCTACPSNSVSAAGSSYGKCTCKAGYFKLFSDAITFTCEACSEGSWAGANSTVCTLCAAGTAQPSTTSSECMRCDAGTFAVAGSRTCVDCPVWSYSGAASGNCTPCQIGQFAPTKSMTCSMCSAGSYSLVPVGSQAECLSCPKGAYCPGAAVALADKKGQVRDCPTGTYSDLLSRSSVDQCIPCPANYFCPLPTLKTPCPTGTGSNASSSSQLQCTCRVGYSCSYTKVLNAVVTLQMSEVQFANEAVQLAFRQAVADASKTTVDKVTIIGYKVKSSARRLLQLGSRQASTASVAPGSERSGDDALEGLKVRRATATHRGVPQHDVFLEIQGSSGLFDLDRHMVKAGLDPSLDLAWCSPHAVSVRRSDGGALI